MDDFKALSDQDLRNKRGELVGEIRKLADEFEANGKQWKDDEQRQTYETVNAEYDTCHGEMTRRTQAAEIAARAAAVAEVDEPASVSSQPGSPPAQRGEQRVDEAQCRALALQAWLRHQSGLELTERHAVACRQVGFDPRRNSLDIRLNSSFGLHTPAWCRGGQADLQRRFESRAQSVGVDSGGGYTVPEGFVNEVEIAMLAFGGPRQVARILRTASGNDLPWPTLNDTANKGALLGENTQVTNQDMTFANIVFHAYKYESKAILVSQELLEDEAVNLVQIIGQIIGERLGRATSEHYTTGDGASKPNGMVTAATVGKTAASATAITADELIDLQHSVDPSYRASPSAGWMFKDSTLAAIRKLKDGNGQYLWQPGIRGGAPDLLLNHPYTINQDMAAIASTAKTVLFGDFSKYVIRDVNAIRFFRLEERYRDFDQTGFMAFLRTDGDLLDAGTNPVKVLQQAA